jgi:hypothetical protein
LKSSSFVPIREIRVQSPPAVIWVQSVAQTIGLIPVMLDFQRMQGATPAAAHAARDGFAVK